MWPLIVLALGVVITALSFSGGDALIEERSLSANQIAEHMMIVHGAATRACMNAPCPTGSIDFEDRLPFSARNATTTLLDGTIRSYSDGSGLVVTLYGPASGGSDNVLRGHIASRIVENVETAILAGAYDLANERVGRGSFFVGDVEYFGMSVPSNIGGATINDGDPIIVSRVD